VNEKSDRVRPWYIIFFDPLISNFLVLRLKSGREEGKGGVKYLNLEYLGTSASYQKMSRDLFCRAENFTKETCK